MLPALGNCHSKMRRGRVRANGWAVLKLPNETLKVLQIIPNTLVTQAGPVFSHAANP